jgi:hypothetical protein
VADPFPPPKPQRSTVHTQTNNGNKNGNTHHYSNKDSIQKNKQGTDDEVQSQNQPNYCTSSPELACLLPAVANCPVLLCLPGPRTATAASPPKAGGPAATTPRGHNSSRRWTGANQSNAAFAADPPPENIQYCTVLNCAYLLTLPHNEEPPGDQSRIMIPQIITHRPAQQSAN